MSICACRTPPTPLPGTGAPDARARSRPGLQSSGRDDLSAALAPAVGPVAHAHQRCLDLEKMAFGLLHQRDRLGTLVGDRVPLGVVLVVGVGVTGGVHDTGEVVTQPCESLLGLRPFGGEQVTGVHPYDATAAPGEPVGRE